MKVHTRVNELMHQANSMTWRKKVFLFTFMYKLMLCTDRIYFISVYCKFACFFISVYCIVLCLICLYIVEVASNLRTRRRQVSMLVDDINFSFWTFISKTSLHTILILIVQVTLHTKLQLPRLNPLSVLRASKSGS